MQVTKVVIPAAGLGTRFLPITKAIPKEMLPILEKPAIHYIAQEALLSDINDLCFIISKNKNSIADYFDYSMSLDFYLEQKSKKNLLSELDFLIKNLNFHYIRQQQPFGLGHAVMLAEHFIQEQFFSVMLPDDIIFSDIPCLKQLVEVSKAYNCCVIAIQEISSEETSSYGIIKIKEKLSSNIFEIDDLIEKPESNPPSNFAIIGRYVLSRNIFPFLHEISKDNSQEIQLTQALKNFVNKGNRLLALKFNGNRYDLGTPYGWAKANQFVMSKPFVPSESSK